MNLVEAAQSPKLFDPSYSGESWNVWWSVLKAAYALPMTAAEIEVFRSVADRDPPTRPVKEFWVIAGRRAGKDSIAALIATFHAISFSQKKRLRPGERAMVMCLAVDRIQARIIFSYIRGLFEHPLLAPLIERETSSVLELTPAVRSRSTLAIIGLFAAAPHLRSAPSVASQQVIRGWMRGQIGVPIITG